MGVKGDTGLAEVLVKSASGMGNLHNQSAGNRGFVHLSSRVDQVDLISCPILVLECQPLNSENGQW